MLVTLLVSTRVVLSEHASVRLGERFPEWSTEEFLREFRRLSRVPDRATLLQINQHLERQSYRGRVSPTYISSRHQNVFYVVLREYQILCVLCSPAAGLWVIKTLYKYECP